MLAVLLGAGAVYAVPPQGEQVIHTKDGRELRGVVTAESQTGYTLRASDGSEQLVPFAEIQDMVPAGEPAVAPPPPPPPMPPPEPGTPPPPAPEAPQPEQPEEPAVADWRSERKGFHWSIGAGGMIDPGLTSTGSSSTFNPTFFVGAVPAIRWGFGWLDLQAELMPMGYFRGATKAFFLGLNPQLRINFARFYSLGVGLYGAVVISPRVDFLVGPSLSPAIFRFGDMGQHEVRFWMAQPMLATSVGLSSNITLLMLSYSYVF